MKTQINLGDKFNYVNETTWTVVTNGDGGLFSRLSN